MKKTAKTTKTTKGNPKIAVKNGRLKSVPPAIDRKKHGANFHTASAKKRTAQEMALLLNNTEENFLLVDTSFNIIIFNKQFQFFYSTHFGKEVRKGDCILDHAIPGYRDQLTEIYKQVFKGERLESELELPLPDKTVLTFSNRFKPAYDEKGHIIGASLTIVDITEKKKSQQQLIINERRYRALVENGNDAVTILSETGRPFYVSPSVQGVLGYEEEEILQMDILTLIHPDDFNDVYDGVAIAMSRPGVTIPGFICRVRHKKGNWCWLEATLTNMLHDPAINGIVNNFRDVTERKEADEKIRFAKERYDNVARATNEAIWDWDILNKSIHWADGFRTLFGHDPEKDASLDGWTSHIHPEDVERVTTKIMKAVHSNDTSQWEDEYRYLKSDGTYANVFDRGFVIRDSDGEATRMIGAMLDMTQKLKTDQALRDSEEKTRLIMNAALDAIICMDTKGVITFWNPHAEKIFGWKAAEVMGRLLSETILPPSLRALHVSGIENYLKTGHAPALNVLMELSAINNEKKEFPIELTILPIKQGKEEFFCAFVRDITERKAIEQQLSDAHSFNQTIIENCPVGIWIFEESGQTINVNQAGLELAGAKSGDMLSLNFRKLESWKTEGLYDAALEALETGKLIRKEIHARNIINKDVWYEAMLVPVRFKGKKHLILMTYDIRERMIAEEALKRNKSQLSIANQLAKLGYWELNIAEGIFTFNDHFYTMLQTTAEEMGGYDMPAEKYGRLFLHPDDSALVQNEIRLAIETTDPNYSRHIEHRIIHPNGEVGHLGVRFYVVKDEEGRTIKTVGANQNITEQKLAADLVRHAKERYEMAFKATNDAIYEWDMVNDCIYWGEGYETLFGHKRTGETMSTESWSKHLHPDEKEKLFAERAEAFEKNKTSLTRELRFRCADGSYKKVFDKLVILYNEEKKPVKLFGAKQDISELKKNETAINELNDQLNKRAEELAISNSELERFAYVASHDLQEPLRMVSSFLQLLQKKYSPQLDETAIQYIDYAVDGADRMKRLILDLLEYSRVGTNQDISTKTDTSEIVIQILNIFDNKIKETDAVITVHPLPVAKVNVTQLTQLIQNLVGNALKYNKSEIPRIEIGCEEKKDAWQFFIKDNGIGIDSKFFDKVFIIFQRLHNKNQFSGTGIGLAICKKIVERHGGTIWVESELGKGSTFFFTIKK